jgi:hypothetical protein
VAALEKRHFRNRVSFYFIKKVRGVKVEKIIKSQQPNIHKKLKENSSKKKSKRGKEHLSFSDVMELMKHSSYKRSKGGAIRQIK